MKFRIMKNKQGFYPQVKLAWYKPWRRIFKLTSGYGLSCKNDTDCPCESAKEARVIIDRFYDWIKEDTDKLEFVKYHDPTDRFTFIGDEKVYQCDYGLKNRKIARQKSITAGQSVNITSLLSAIYKKETQ
jgi:hypothetical protein